MTHASGARWRKRPGGDAGNVSSRPDLTQTPLGDPYEQGYPEQ